MEEQIYKIIRIDEEDFGCEGGQAIVGADGMLYAPGAIVAMEEVIEVPVDFEKQAAWMENYWDAIDELEDME